MVTESQFFLLKSQLADSPSLRIKLASNSMAPILPEGTEATLCSTAFDDIKPMDFIVFYDNGRLLCHAAWEQNFFKAPNGERTLITRGLSNPFFDAPVRESFILGRVTSHQVTRFRFYWLAMASRFKSLGSKR